MAAAGMMLPAFSCNCFAAIEPRERWLRLYNVHTEEALNTCYWRNGQYLPAGTEAINHFFRDFRNGSVMDVDTSLLDLMYTISERAPRNSTINLISGYRSPETNRLLRQNSSGVAKKSYHMEGRAADIRIPGIVTSSLRNIATDLKMGGVGYYQDSDFVHVDTGPVRQW